jgi:hypothetical protein
LDQIIDPTNNDDWATTSFDIYQSRSLSFTRLSSSVLRRSMAHKAFLERLLS